jgi:hypothetical protein
VQALKITSEIAKQASIEAYSLSGQSLAQVGSQKGFKMKRSKSARESPAKTGGILCKRLLQFLQRFNQFHKITQPSDEPRHGPGIAASVFDNPSLNDC